MKDFNKEYEKWLNDERIDQQLLSELKDISGQIAEIEERFHKDLEFGTGGLRGIISAGTNRINIYTIRKATLGLAKYIISQGEAAIKQGVVIAYDSRRYSKEFAYEAAKVLATKKIKVYIFAELMPTPLLSFAVRSLKTFSGIVITASHNPAEYNGYKVYDKYGGQITEDITAEIYQHIEKIEDILALTVVDFAEGLRTEQIMLLGTEIEQQYLEMVEDLLINTELSKSQGDQISIIYTPLHGTGNKAVNQLLKRIGYTNVFTVKEQEQPHPDFPTVKAPNPEERVVFDLAINLASVHNADIIMATDPDADRLGVLVKNQDNHYQGLTGNQLGALILNYILAEKSQRQSLPTDGVLVKTIVTSELGKKIAAKYNVTTNNTLTGFKYIGEKIQEYKDTGSQTFIFGYEESYGFLAGDFVRDKDAVQITAIVAEMVLKYKIQRKNLFNVLEEIYQEHGFHVEDLIAKSLKGIVGSKKISEIVSAFRENPPTELAGFKVVSFEDYLQKRKIAYPSMITSELDLPEANVIKLILEDESWVAIRPSGTEPKIKFYVAAVAKTKSDALNKLEVLKAEILQAANL